MDSLAAFRHYNIPIQVTKLTDWENAFFSQLEFAFNSSLQHFKTQKPSVLIPFYVNDAKAVLCPNYEINGYSFLHDGIEYVSITHGLMKYIWAMSYRIAIECLNKNSKFDGRHYNEYFIKIWNESTTIEIDFSTQINLLAQAIAKATAYFVYFHEVAHLINGHYLISKYLFGVSKNIYAESGEQRINLDVNLSKALEIFADNYAAQQLTFGVIARPFTYFGDFKKSNRKLSLNLCCISAILLFYIINLPISDEQKIANLSHPDPLSRTCVSIYTIFESLSLLLNHNKDDTPIDFNDFWENEFLSSLAFVNRAWTEAELQFPKSGKTKSIKELFKLSMEFKSDVENKYLSLNEDLKLERFNILKHE
jgi:hypothetical protein